MGSSIGGILGKAAGSAIGGPIGGQIGGALGSAVLGGIGSRGTSQAYQGATAAQIAAQQQAARQMAEASKFRPVGVTSPYGQAQYQVDDQGRLQQVGFDLAPEFQERATTFGTMGSEALGAVNIDPQQAAADRTARMQELLAPGRAMEQERLFSNLAAKGLTGLAVETGTGARVNPYQAAQAAEMGQMDRAIAAESLDQARRNRLDDIRLAQGLFGAQQGVYDIGRSELDYGLDLSDRERIRAMDAAKVAGGFGMQTAQLQGQQGIQAAQQREAELNRYDQLLGGALGGIMNPSQPSTGFRFFEDQSFAPGSTFPQGTAAGDYASNFQFSTMPAPAPTQQAFALPNYAPPQFRPTVVDPNVNRTRPISAFGDGANQPLFISP